MVTRGGEIVELSRTEWLLLQHLAANAGKVVLHTELLTKVWGPEYRDDLQYLRVWVSRVRRKLGAKPGEPGRIKTFQGIGYLLDVEAGHVGRARRTPGRRPTAQDPARDPGPVAGREPGPGSPRLQPGGQAHQVLRRPDAAARRSGVSSRGGAHVPALAAPTSGGSEAGARQPEGA